MIYDDIKRANIEAMKNKDQQARAVLSVVLTKCKLLEVESKANGKSFGENEVLVIIQKVLKELFDEKSGYENVGREDRANDIQKQIDVLSIYLPKQLNEQEIKEIIEKLEDNSIPSVMKYFKENFSGKVDMSLVSKLARGL